jgi:hypothetical protein
MNTDKLKRIGKITVKALFVLIFMGALSMPFLSGGLKDLRNPLSHKEITEFDSMVTTVFSSETIDTEQTDLSDNLMDNIQNFIDAPEGSTPWEVFGKTGQTPYTYTDEEGEEWNGVRPEFPDDLKKLDGTDILIQGYMFPLGQDEEQTLFLLGPFPLSCPYHYHVTPNLIIEAHTTEPIMFSYDAVNITGQLELVPKDDEYNVFFRLKNAQLLQ